ncbi:MAG: hypothetical protein U1E29_06170 [Coriobacteriia bacterium]|nr:hypothetical protein [Coriobacteriia bacterium]
MRRLSALVAIIALVFVGLATGGCSERLETGTIYEYEDADTNGEQTPSIGMQLDDGRNITASITAAEAEANGIDAESARSETQRAEVRMRLHLVWLDVTSSFEFIRLLEPAGE